MKTMEYTAKTGCNPLSLRVLGGGCPKTLKQQPCDI